MPDLNELLRWSIMNSTAAQQGTAGAAAPAEPAADPANEQMTLRFRPTANPSAASSALHPNDPQYRPPGMPYDEDDSPPSSAGPATPKEGAALLPGTRAPAGPSHLNSEIIDLILGRPDSAVMKEKMEIAMDESRSVDERVEALDDFEMLIEHIDNANNLVVLKMWEPLIALLSSSSPEIVTNALWIIGTSVQNNVKAQAALYQNNVLPRILSLIYPSSASGSSTTSETAATASSSTPSRAVRAKATYAFSAAVKAWPLASAALSTNGYEGYSVLKRGVQDDDVVVRRKMAFLVNTLVLQSEETFEGEMPKEVVEMLKDQAGEVKAAGSLVHGLKAQGVVDALAQGLTQPGDGDLEYEENAMRALSHAAGKGGLSDNVQKQVKGVWEQWGSAGQVERGLSGEDGKAVQALLDGSA